MQESSVYEHLVQTAGKEYYQQGIEQGHDKMQSEPSLGCLSFGLMAAPFRHLDPQ